ncbi:MAG: 30S ribosomal protein S9 [Candidatus Omnitrophica bacterium]|nr:30S ribosomal protein S9 [Candidatus Omnitrophota bacterium]
MKIPIEKKEILSTGRRKTSTARVKVISNGKGVITVNKKPLEKYFPVLDHQAQIVRPLRVAEMIDKVDVKVNVTGGGVSGQAGAISLGIARSLLTLEPTLRSLFRKEDLLTRDPRAKERKKYGRKGARRRFQWTKR